MHFTRLIFVFMLAHGGQKLSVRAAIAQPIQATTPCPLILAVPVALVAGLSRAAHFGVLIKGAKPLESLARIKTLIVDKTGTLTDGRPQIVSISTLGGASEQDILYFAAAMDQASKHPIAQTIVAAARARGMALPVPEMGYENKRYDCFRSVLRVSAWRSFRSGSTTLSN